MRRTLAVAVVAAAALALPAAAWAHAALLKTFPTASAEVDTPPAQLRLVYDEELSISFGDCVAENFRGERHATAG